MKSFRERFTWRLAYAVGTLVYLVWVGYLSLNNIDMVNSRYRRAKERLEPSQVETAALQELVDQCRQEQQRASKGRSSGDGETVEGADPCLAWTPDVVEARQNKVRDRLLDERRKAGYKLILFYLSFVIIFLVLPVVIVYWLLAFIIWMVRGKR